MQLKMYRPPHLPLPNIPPPAGFAIRAMRPGEEAAWSFCCLGEFDITQATAEGFHKKMHDQPLSEIFFICGEDDTGAPGKPACWGGRPVGTATAQLLEGKPFLHYIAVHPDFRGRGLAKPLMSQVLARHAELGRRGCFLTTDDPRLPAINSYVQLGYCPVLWSDDAAPRWHSVMRQLGLARLEAYGDDGEPAGALELS